METIATMNARHGRPGRLEFVEGPGGLPLAQLHAAGASAEVMLYAGHVLSYRRGAGPAILWLSREAAFAPGKAIRGGVPVCWPWFGPHPSDPGKPAHGLARTRMWRLIDAEVGPGHTGLRLGLSDDEATRAIWPHPFQLALAVRLGAELAIDLTTTNPGPGPLTVGGALHSYFTVADVERVRILGLEGAAYLDQLSGVTATQAGPVTIAGEVDRVYQDTAATCVIEDPLIGRRISVAKRGSRSTVVWNPWAEKARRLADFADDEYGGMVCVETANALADSVTLAPGASHTLGLTIEVE